MKKNGLKGKLIIDLRDITYWCNAVAQKLETLGDQVPRGDLGITMKQRKSQTEPYPEKAKRIFAEALEYLNAEAKRGQWVDYLLLVEEEIGNRFPVKLAGYASFMPVLMKVCPERAVVVDNEIGYGATEKLTAEPVTKSLTGSITAGQKPHLKMRKKIRRRFFFSTTIPPAFPSDSCRRV